MNEYSVFPPSKILFFTERGIHQLRSGDSLTGKASPHARRLDMNICTSLPFRLQQHFTSFRPIYYALFRLPYFLVSISYVFAAFLSEFFAISRLEFDAKRLERIALLSHSAMPCCASDEVPVTRCEAFEYFSLFVVLPQFATIWFF